MAERVFVTGTPGLVGSRFIEMAGGRYDFVTPQYPDFDLTRRADVVRAINDGKPNVIVNFAAYTNVSDAEKQRGDKDADCWRINVEGVKNLLESIPSGCHFVQISTDMVFPGSVDFPGPYAESSIPETDPDKVTWYGFTKAEAERLANERLSGKLTILRLIYPFRSRYDLKPDYLRKPLKLYDDGNLYPLFTDQQVSILFIDKIYPALAKILDERIFGTFHASSEDVTNPFDMVTYLLEKARGAKNVVKPASLDEFLKDADNPVRYPKFGGLKVEETERELNVTYGTWREMVDGFVAQL